MPNYLDALAKLPIKIWRYKKEIDPRQVEHIGPLAEDWKRIMGYGDGVTIDQIDAVGICLVCIKSLNSEVAELKARVAKLETK